jgi:hypothetical protein
LRFRDLLHAARVELLEPKAQRPSYRQLLHWGVGVLQSRTNRLSNTGRAWAVDDTTLSVVSGVGDYTLPTANVGKVLDVTNVVDTVNGPFEEWQVPFHDLSDMAGDWSGSDTAQRIAFSRRDGQLHARVRPVPSESRDYRVSYSVGGWAEDASLDDSPLLQEFHHLFVAEIALNALPGAEWSGDEKADDAKRNRLERSFLRRVQQGDRDFDLYVAALSVPRNTQRYEAYPIE